MFPVILKDKQLSFYRNLNKMRCVFKSLRKVDDYGNSSFGTLITRYFLGNRWGTKTDVFCVPGRKATLSLREL